ncbi:MAG: DUF4188 domain-containing protein [Chloroflexi bacterium]|nr:DUF4188 domain-containing protein [Chloroflexota bacterium]
MTAVIREKYTVQLDEARILFLVGGHANNVFAFWDWFWVARAFLNLIRYLRKHPDTGFLSGHLYLRVFPFGMMLQSYWRSFDDLEHFARAKNQPHLQAWTRYMQHTMKHGHMAIWHETYHIEPGKFEAVYGNSAPYGLAKNATVVLTHGRQHNARGRMNPQDQQVAEEPLIPIAQ